MTDPDTTTPHATRVLDFLTREGFRPEFDEDGDVRFKYEGWTFWVMISDDPTHLRVAHPNFWPLDDDAERRRALAVAAEVQWRFRVGRLTVLDRTVWATVEAYLPDEHAFEKVLLRNLSALQALVSEFVDAMRAQELD